MYVRIFHRLRLHTVTLAALLALYLCWTPAVGAADHWQELEVTASAYTLAVDEGHDLSPGIGAWGDRLKPDMQVIAVSRDLIPLGLGHRARVQIEGFPGVFRVRDKMHRRWRNKIDILVPSKKQAYEWGKRKVRIKWLPE